MTGAGGEARSARGALSYPKVYMRRIPWLSLAAAAALYGQTIKTGPAAGSPAPDFSALDQAGHTQTLKSIMGPKGAMLVFYRSADW